MAFDVSVSNSLYAYVAIFPNANDDWSATSPFSGYNLSGGKTALAIGTLDSDTFTNFVRVPSKLLSISNIDKGINIFEGNKHDLKVSKEILGVGGVAMTGSFSIEFENSNRTIMTSNLIGRTISLWVANGTAMSDTTADKEVLFTGKIYSIDDSGRVGLKIEVRSNLSLWDKEIGTPTESESTIYNSKIIPMVYGDFSDDFAYVPIVMDKDFRNFAQLFLDERKLNEVLNFYCWDKDSKVAYLATNGNDSVLNTDNNRITMYSDNDLYLVDATIAIADWFKTSYFPITLWNPPYVIFAISGTVTTEPVGHTIVATGTVYYDAEGNMYEFLYMTSTYYVFTARSEDYIYSELSGTLTKHSGTGDSSLTFTWHSAVRDPHLFFESAEEVYNSVLVSSAKAEQILIQVEDEKMLLVTDFTTECVAVAGKNGYYEKSSTHAYRGYDGTSAVVHAALSSVYEVNGKIKGSKWLVKHKFISTGFAGFSTSMRGTYKVAFEGTNAFVDDWAALEENFISANDFITVARSGDGYVIGLPIRRYWNVTTFGSLGSAILALDLLFPTVNISGEVLDIFVIGGIAFQSKDFTQTYGLQHTAATACIVKGGSLKPHIYVKQESTSRRTAGTLRVVSADYTSSTGFAMEGLGRWALQPEDYLFQRMNYLADTIFPDDVGCFLFESRGQGFRGFYTPDYLPLTDPLYAAKYPQLSSDESFSLSHSDLEYDGVFGNINQLGTQRYALCICEGFQVKYGSQVWSGLINDTLLTTIKEIGFLIHFYVDPVETPFYTKVYGREFDAAVSYFDETASGMIENAADVIEDILRREVGLTDAELDETSFDAVRPLRDTWKLATVIQGEPVLLTQLLNNIAREFGLIVYETREGKIGLNTLDVPAATGSLREILDSELVTEDEKVVFQEEYTSLSSLFTGVNVNYARNHADDSYGYNAQTDAIEDLTQLLADTEDFTDEAVSATINFEGIRDSLTANQSVYLIALYHKAPLRKLTISGILSLYDVDVGDWVYFDTATYIPGTGSKVYLVINSNLTLPLFGAFPNVTLELIEMDIGANNQTFAEVTDAYFTGGYPGSQTELKAGDTFDLTVETDKDIVAIEVMDSQYYATEGEVFEFSASQSETVTVTIADRGAETQFMECMLRVQSADGVWSSWIGTSDFSEVDGTGKVYLNNTYPFASVDMITYPTDQDAISSGELAVVYVDEVNCDSVVYSSPNSQLTIHDTTVMDDKVCDYAAGDYNTTEVNFQGIFTRAANGATYTLEVIVAIANAAPVIRITESAELLRSGPSVCCGGTGAEYYVYIVSDQILLEVPTLAPDSSDTETEISAFELLEDLSDDEQTLLVDYLTGHYIYRATITIYDDTGNGVFDWESLVATGLAGVEQNTITADDFDDTYEIRGFIERTLTFAAWTNRERGIGKAVHTIGNVVVHNLSKGDDYELTLRTSVGDEIDTFTITDPSATYNANGNLLYNCDLANAVSNTSGTLQMTIEETI